MRSTAIIKPIAPRYIATQMGDSLRITLPSRSQWLFMIPISLVLLVWLSAALFVIVALGAILVGATEIRVQSVSGSLFLLGLVTLMLVLFSAGSLRIIYVVLWNLAGREVIEASRQSIRLSRVVPGWTRTQEYLAEHIRDLRVSPQYMPNFQRQSVMGFFGLGGAHGQLAFDYGARTIHCADADEAEVKMMLAEIRQRFPQYGAGDNAIPV